MQPTIYLHSDRKIGDLAIVASMSTLRESVDKKVSRLEIFNSSLFDLLSLFSSFNHSFDIGINVQGGEEHKDISKSASERITESSTYEKSSEITKKLGGMIKGIGTAGDAGLKMAEAFKWTEKLSEKSRAGMKLLGAVKPLGEAIKGAGELGAATGFMEAVTGSAGIIGGAESAAAALATFGSVPGMIAGGVILTGGAVLGGILYEKEQQLQKRALREKEYAKNTASFYYPGMDEYSAITTLPTKRLQERRAYNGIEDLSLHADPTPVGTLLPVADNLKVAPPAGYPIRNDHRLFLPPNSWDNVLATRDKIVNIGKEKGYVTYQNTIYDLINGKSELGKGMSKEAKETTARLANDAMISKAKKNAETAVQASQGSSGSSITFNRALIEHFTINVKDSREGIKDFKRKVEEVLLEILNTVTYN